MPEVRTIVIETIAHDSQRYETPGDWLYDEAGGKITIFTSDLGDWRMSMATGIHEVVEVLQCVRDGVSDEVVCAFDIEYEKARDEGRAASCGCVPNEDSEPGEDRHAPYRKQHAVADVIERLLALSLGVVWDEYGEKSGNLKQATV